MKGLFKVVLVLVVVGLAIFFAGRWWLKGKIDEELTAASLVELLEKEINSRVEIGGLEHDLLSDPARLVLTGVKLGVRDEVADAGVPLGEREAMGEEDVVLGAEVLEVELARSSVLGLLRGGADGDVVVRRSHVKGLKLVSTGYAGEAEDGSEDYEDLELLFQAPAVVAGQPRARAGGDSVEQQAGGEEEGGAGAGQPGAGAGAGGAGGAGEVEQSGGTEEGTEVVVEAGEGPEATEEEEEGGLAWEALPGRIRIDELEVEGGELEWRDSVAPDRTVITGLMGRVYSLLLDPGDFEGSNHGELEVKQGRITFYVSESGSEPLAELDLEGNGSLYPFDPATRRFDPIVEADVVLKAGSHARGVARVEDVVESLSGLRETGIDLTPLLDLELEEDAVTRLRYQDDLYTLMEGGELRMGGNLLRLEAGSWFETDDRTHHFRGHIYMGEEATVNLNRGVDRALADRLGALAAVGARMLVLNPLLKEVIDEEGRLNFRFEREGDLVSALPRPLFEGIVGDLIDALMNQLEE